MVLLDLHSNLEEALSKQLAETISDILKKREWNWKPEVVKASAVDDLKKVRKKHIMKCVDGRPSDNKQMYGPKTLGGVYAIASVRGIVDLDGLMSVTHEVLKAGWVPSVHGDDHAHPGPLGCGYFKLWSQGKLDGLERPRFTSSEGARAVLTEGGTYERLIGAHDEQEVVINLVDRHTLVPDARSQRFVVDAWVAGAFKLDLVKYLTLAAQTVELLSPQPGNTDGKTVVEKVRIIWDDRAANA